MKFSESVAKVVESETFALAGFYDRLFARYPEFQPYFSESSLKRQVVMLTMALVGVKHYPIVHAPAHAYLQVLGTKHRGRGVAKELYAKFIEVLVDEVAEFHADDWNESLARQWTEALNLVVATMHEGYDDEQPVEKSG